jgi:hypothetical protein
MIRVALEVPLHPLKIPLGREDGYTGLSKLASHLMKDTVAPKRLLVVTGIIMAVGTFVLQYRIAPSLRRRVTSSDSFSCGELAHVTNPSVESYPLTLNKSFSETGRPCNYS